MKRFPIDPGTVIGDIAVLRGEIFRHVKKVCRMTTGDSIVLFDGTGAEHLGTIGEVGSSSLTVRIEETRSIVETGGIDVWLGQGIPKSTKMDLVIQKATELGVTRVLPFTSSRTVPRPGFLEEGDESHRVGRWRKVAAEASRQCGRTSIPRIDEVASLDEVVERGRDRGLCLVLWEGEAEGGRRLREALTPWDGTGGVVLLVGPEGGFAAEEVARAEAKGYLGVSLGRRILRAETASFTALAILQYVFGDLG